MALTRHLESESILIGYLFRARSSRPRVTFHFDPESFLSYFRAWSSRPRVTFHYGPESFPFHLELGALDPESRSISTQSHFPFRPRVILSYFRAWSSRPRVTFHFDPESFFPILDPGALDPESFSIMPRVISFSI